MTDLLKISATRLAARLAQQEVRPTEVVEAYLDAIERYNPEIRAFTHIDRRQVMDAARMLEQSVSKGRLYGVPLAVKDVLDTCDMPSAYGSPIWDGHRPRSDAAVVAMARRAGAMIIGKSATTEFATKFAPQTVNPHNFRHTPGGSSSGSAAAVAAGIVPLALGTQTAGSIVRPASYCGVVGYKPTFGYIHRAGMKVMSEALDTIGAIARSVEDAALLVEAITGRDLGSADGGSGAPRIAVVLDLPTPLTPPMSLRLDEVADLLSRSGASVKRVVLPAAIRQLFDSHPIVMNSEIAKALTWEYGNRRSELSNVLRDTIEEGRAYAPETIDAALRSFEIARASFADMMRSYDVVLTASALGEAPAGLESTGDPVCCIIWTALHVPSISLPAGAGPNGLPLGIQVIGRHNEDRGLLTVARWIETRLK